MHAEDLTSFEFGESILAIDIKSAKPKRSFFELSGLNIPKMGTSGANILTILAVPSHETYIDRFVELRNVWNIELDVSLQTGQLPRNSAYVMLAQVKCEHTSLSLRFTIVTQLQAG